MEQIINKGTTSIKSLVTFVVLAYNQEKYISEAINAALAQTYSPLEIIISDDCSTDQTWDIIKETVREYKGPHQVFFVRNEQNMGITSHVNKLFAMAQGDLIVMAAGDDISVPHRTAALFEAWSAQGKPDAALHSALLTISDEPDFVSRVIIGKGAHANKIDLNWYLNNKRINMPIIGASAAYTRSLFKFGPMMHDGLIEDRVLTYRAILTGKIIYIDQILVQYRISEINISMRYHVSQPEKWKKWVCYIKKCTNNHIIDYVHYCNSHDAQIDKEVISTFEKIINDYEKLNFLVSNKLHAVAYSLWIYFKLEGFVHTFSFIFIFFTPKNTIFYKIVFKCKKILKNLVKNCLAHE